MKYKSVYNIILLAILSVVLSSSVLSAQEPTAKTFFDLGIEQSKNTEYSEAIDSFEHAIKLKPNYAEAYFNLGHVYFNLHRYTEAADAYKKAVEINPKYSEAYVTLGIVSSMLSRYDDAVEALEKAVKVSPKNADAYYRLGNIYIEIADGKQHIGIERLLS